MSAAYQIKAKAQYHRLCSIKIAALFRLHKSICSRNCQRERSLAPLSLLWSQPIFFCKLETTTILIKSLWSHVCDKYHQNYHLNLVHIKTCVFSFKIVLRFFAGSWVCGWKYCYQIHFYTKIWFYSKYVLASCRWRLKHLPGYALKSFVKLSHICKCFIKPI